MYVPAWSAAAKGNHGNWYIRAALDYFQPIYERMHKLMIEREIIHVDETKCQVLHEEGKAPEGLWHGGKMTMRECVSVKFYSDNGK